MKSSIQLIDLISKMEPLDFAGLAKLLGVQIVEINETAENEKEKFTPRSFTDVFSDIMVKFEKLNRTRKREILKLIKKSNAARGGKIDASTSANS